MHLNPFFGSLKLKEITLEKVDRLIAERNYLSPKTLNNVLTLLISMLRLANDLGWLDNVPKIKKPRVSIFSSDFQYLRLNMEIMKLLTESRIIH